MTSVLWTRENLAWLAGLLEGEGAFMLMMPRLFPVYRVALNMTDKDIVERAALIAGAGRVRGPYHDGKANHKPFYRWWIDKRAFIYALCAALLPWMGARRTGRIRQIMESYRTSGRVAWRHGTRWGYERGCRCAPCRAAHAARFRERRRRRNAQLKFSGIA